MPKTSAKTFYSKVFLVCFFSIKLTYKLIIIRSDTFVNTKILVCILFVCRRMGSIDMTLFERIKQLSEKRNKNVKEVAIDLGFSENLFYKWKTSDPKAVDLEKVADYFGVSVDYLLGRETEVKTEKDLDDMIDNAMFYDGKPLSDTDREIVKAYLEGKFGSK